MADPLIELPSFFAVSCCIGGYVVRFDRRDGDQWVACNHLVATREHLVRLLDAALADIDVYEEDSRRKSYATEQDQ